MPFFLVTSEIYVICIAISNYELSQSDSVFIGMLILNALLKFIG